MGSEKFQLKKDKMKILLHFYSFCQKTNCLYYLFILFDFCFISNGLISYLIFQIKYPILSIYMKN